MKQSLILVCLVLIAVSSHAQVTEEQKIILDLETRRTHAIDTHDDAFLNSLLDDGYYGVAASGAVVRKAEQLNVYKTVNAFVHYSYEDMLATVYGTTSVVTGKRVTTSKTGSVLGQTRYMLVYSNLSGKWRVVSGQETDVIKP